jgi:hypothetical protein
MPAAPGVEILPSVTSSSQGVARAGHHLIGTMAELPTFVQSRPLTREALEYAGRFHEGQEREADHAPFILHPLEVAAILDGFGFDDSITAAAVLHDSLEETEMTEAQIEKRFGARVARLVEVLTEPELRASEGERKGALREQIAIADGDAAAIFAADKISKTRELRLRRTWDPGYADDPATTMKTEHYWKSLSMLEQTLDEHPLVKQLRFELEAIRAWPPHTAAGEQ